MARSVTLLFLMYVRTRQNYGLFFFNDTVTTEIFTLSLHDALPILGTCQHLLEMQRQGVDGDVVAFPGYADEVRLRSEDHTSELQSHLKPVCRLLLHKKNHRIISYHILLSLYACLHHHLNTPA